MRIAAFHLAETELTQAQWTALYEARRGRQEPLVLAPNPAYFTADHGGGPEHPVEQVTWYDAAGFANLLSSEVGVAPCYRLESCTGAVGKGLRCASASFEGTRCAGYRLPTEAEWEYAARAGTTSALYSGPIELRGDNDAPAVGRIGWYGGNSGLTGGAACGDWPEREDARLSACGTHPVRGKLANAWGLYDAIGNVWEWTSSVHAAYARTAADDPGAVGPLPMGGRAVMRGCSWASLARYCRAANRNANDASYRGHDAGFRLARSDPRPSSP